MEMEDLGFHFDDPDESSIDPKFFNMTNPTLNDLSNGNGNNVGASSSLFQHFNNGSHSNHHGLGILQHGVFQQGRNFNHNHHHGVFQHDIVSDTFNSNAMPQQSHQQGQGGGNSDPFNYNVVSPENHQQGQSGNNDSFNSTTMSQQIHHGGNSNFSFGGNNFDVGSTSQIMHGNQQQSQPAIPISVSPDQTDEVLTLDEWPPTQMPYFCSCCQVLREIIHANGFQFEKLEIHGRLGLITHAIHHQTPVNGVTPIYQMIDFSKSGLDKIKKYLAKYCVERNSLGYFMLQDPMSAFYETVCTGLDWIDDINMEGLIDYNQNSPDEMMDQEHGTSDKKDLSAQRRKSANLTLSDLRDYFHLPIEEASDHPNVKLCPTVLKKICRKAGLQRWPYRKVKSLLKQIALMDSQLDSQDPATRAKNEEEINKLKQEMIAHCGGIIPTAMYNINAFLPPQYQQQQQ